MLFGYARVSTENQNLDSQLDALKMFDVDPANIYCDKDSGKKTDRKGLNEMLGRLRKGDTVYFYDLTRIGRNFKHLITVMEYFAKHEIDFKDISNPAIDTKSMETPAGKLIFRIFASLGEFQREQSNEKVKAGLESAKRQGRFGGRPRGLSARLKKKAPLVAAMYRDTNNSISDIREALNISQASVYKCIKHSGIDITKNYHRNINNNNRVRNTKVKL
jgi:DNA invertase Pin-like site-specific DNA recombinase